MTPWKKFCNNCRASCETGWLQKVPPHVAAAWAGHTVSIQSDHYVQVVDYHDKQFATKAPIWSNFGPEDAQTGANAGEDNDAKHEKTPENACSPGPLIAVEGLEPPTRGL